MTRYLELDYPIISIYLCLVVNRMPGLRAEDILSVHTVFMMLGYLCRYVMDELGSAMCHSDNANFRIAPFLFMPEGKLDTAIRH